MSGPIRPPLRVRDTDSSPNVIPVNTIVVTDGDLVDDGGATVTIDTSGSGGTPATPVDSIQFNSDPAGTFTADAGFVMSVIGGGSTTVTQTGNILTGGNKVSTAVINGTMSIMSEGTGQLILRGSEDAGGTWTDTIVNIMSNANTDEAQLKFRDSVNTDNGSITLDGSGDMVLNNNVAAKDIDLKVLTTGQVEVANQTSDTDTVLSVMGNGTGAPRLDLQNASKRVWIECQTNKKLTVQGGSGGDTFVFDVSSATGGITFPDGTELVSAEGTAILATGVTDGYVLTADGAGASAWEAAGGGGASAIGDLSDAITTATSNIGLGSGSLDSITATEGNYNVAVGINSATAITTADNCIAIGYECMDALETGYRQIAIGSGALGGATSTNDNIAIGYGALASGSYSGTQNVVMGNFAGEAITTGGANLLIAESAGKNIEAGIRNILIGHNSGSAFVDESYNLGIGYWAMRTATTGAEKNIVLAGYLQDSIDTGSNNVVLGAAAIADADGDDQLVISSGDGGVSWIVGDSAGACYQGDNASTWSTTSDQRLKREIVDSVTGLDAINAVQVRNFRYIEKAEPIMETQTDGTNEHERIVGYEGENRYNLDPEPLRVGVIAQEVQDVFPEAVTENAHGHLTVNTDSINWALLKAVQELSAKVEALEGSQ